jgi:hypothetical protein
MRSRFAVPLLSGAVTLLMALVACDLAAAQAVTSPSRWDTLATINAQSVLVSHTKEQPFVYSSPGIPKYGYVVSEAVAMKGKITILDDDGKKYLQLCSDNVSANDTYYRVAEMKLSTTKECPASQAAISTVWIYNAETRMVVASDPAPSDKVTQATRAFTLDAWDKLLPNEVAAGTWTNGQVIARSFTGQTGGSSAFLVYDNAYTPATINTIKRYDAPTRTITLSDDRVYVFPNSVDISKVTVGDKVKIGYTTDVGGKYASTSLMRAN